MAFTLKITKFNDIRRIPAVEDITFAQLREAISSLYQLPSNSSFVLKYTDDEGDLITITSDLELKEAVRFALQSNSRVLKLAVFDPKEGPRGGFGRGGFWRQQQHQQQHQPQHPCPPPHARGAGAAGPRGNNWLENLFEQVAPVAEQVVDEITKAFPVNEDVNNNNNNSQQQQQPAAAAENDFPTVHWATCDSCNERIIGIRYKCNDCPDYDLCSICIEKRAQVHPETHIFEKITKANHHPFNNNGGNGGRRGGCPRWQPRQGFGPFQGGCHWRRFAQQHQQQQQADNNNNATATATTTTTSPVERKEEPVTVVVAAEIPAVVPVAPAPVPVVEEPVVAVPAPVEQQQQEEVQQQQQDAPQSKFAESLKVLEDMGFADREKNIRLLLKNKGDLPRTILNLLE